MIELARA